MSSKHFHFTLGPVQGFVAQARRTRDFWAGSFLLSWLTAHAMKAVLDENKQQNRIDMPSIVDDDLLAMVRGKHKGKPPSTGSIPNNFIATVHKDFDGTVATEAVQNAWIALAEAVWQKDDLAKHNVNKKLWNEQIRSFWDMSWVISDSEDAGVLAQRKNWRSYVPPESEGDKCTMMGEWQELSGALWPTNKTRQAFWNPIMKDKGLDLQEGERLCAIAYVKRRFVHAWKDFELGAHQNWTLNKSVPSTSYMAAAHWIEQVLNHADEHQLKAFHDAAKSLKKDYGEWSTDIQCIADAIDSLLQRQFASLDGRLFFEAELDNKKEFPTNSASLLKNALAALRKISLDSDKKIGAPSPFYAILMMDGDSLGAIKQALAERKQPATALSEALATFTKKVSDIVPQHNGFLVYAGGDDVLAMMPLEDALPCALACRKAYQRAFEGKLDEEHPATISAAIEYAHMKLPLTMVLKDAHALLDDVAKDATGRDAVACRIWKPGGQQQTWAMPWHHAIEGDTLKMVTMAKKLGFDEQGEPGYASKLLYHIRHTLQMLECEGSLDATVIREILVADYLSSGLLDKEKDKAAKEAKARALIVPLLDQCRVFINKNDSKTLTADGALLLRFLAQKGVE